MPRCIRIRFYRLLYPSKSDRNPFQQIVFLHILPACDEKIYIDFDGVKRPVPFEGYRNMIAAWLQTITCSKAQKGNRP